MKKTVSGFTLIELLVVLAIMASLLTLVVPRYFHQTERANETVLKHNLVAMRDAIDKFYADSGRYPSDIAELVSQKYLREMPMDPITSKNDSWQVVAPTNASGVYDVKSGAEGNGNDGSAYNSW
ncbi:type II secretion system protein [Iodobacter sp.]|jgi:general secretion pathway protein G|uniref:type II secretion system protein n=1 Tax=Iodobacter sp. TaxID=1915058 RepID=UPI0025D37376|nr:prepilin-type N-terminal cleavage/methylation domain-containing protein [Iodobacter sp.]